MTNNSTIQKIASTMDALTRATPNVIQLAPKLAQRWLRSNLAGAREIAAQIGVVDRMIYKWASGEVPIPQTRAERILVACKRFKIPLDQLERETDAYLSSKESERGAA